MKKSFELMDAHNHAITFYEADGGLNIEIETTDDNRSYASTFLRLSDERVVELAEMLQRYLETGTLDGTPNESDTPTLNPNLT